MKYDGELWNKYTDDNKDHPHDEVSKFLYFIFVTLGAKKILEADCNVGNNLAKIPKDFEIHAVDLNKQANEIAEGHTQLLEKYTSKGDIVMASPMAAYRTDRILPLENPFNYVLKIQHDFGYESASNEISILRKMVENEEIKMLITYNSTKRNDPKYNDFQEKRFFPFYTKPFSDLLFQNYEKFEENGFYYYLPKNNHN